MNKIQIIIQLSNGAYMSFKSTTERRWTTISHWVVLILIQKPIEQQLSAEYYLVINVNLNELVRIFGTCEIYL